MSIKFECPACGKRLNAPDGAAGRKAKCPACSLSVTVPEPEIVHDAEEISDAPPEEDWEAPAEEEYVVSKRSGRRRTDESEDDVERKPCPMCGEPIQIAARKCRYCGESLVGGKKKGKSGKNKADSELEPIDWVLCILCGGIGCIVGIVYLLQGKPKGGVMIGVAIGFGILWRIVIPLLFALIDAI